MVKFIYFQVNQDLADFMETNDNYATVIYNSERHKTDEFIRTITIVLECERTPAIGMTTLIDRSGRCIVKCSDFSSCQEVCFDNFS